MADVGKLAGCSAATVSMALRNDPRISEATRKKVRKAASELGYEPDPVLSALVARRDSRRKRTVANFAALIDDRWIDSPSLEWLWSMVQGMRSCCDQLGYHLDEFYVERDLNVHRDPDRVLQARGIRGLVLLPPVDDNFRLNLDLKRYAMVVVGNCRLGMERHRVGTDAYAGMQLIFDRIARVGYRRIALAQPLDAEKRLRYEWLSAVSKEHFLPGSPFQIVRPFLPESVVRKADFLQWFKRSRADCLITNYNEFANWLVEAGYRIPEDVGVVFLGWENATYPNASGIAQHLDVSGRSAIEQLHMALMRGEFGLPDYPKEILIRPHWVDGQSIRREGAISGDGASA